MAESNRGEARRRGKGKAKQMDKHTDATYEWQEGVNEAFEDVMASRGDVLPDMSSLLKDAEVIEKKLTKADTPQQASSSSALAEEISDLLPDEDKTPVLDSRPRFDDKISSVEETAEPYQESFASQQETAEMRDEITILSKRLNNLEITIESILSERKNLPVHLDRLSASINQQFTVMNARLNSAIESGVMSDEAIRESAQAAENIGSSSQVLEAVASDLKAAPTPVSQVSQSKPITGKKKKVRLIE